MKKTIIINISGIIFNIDEDAYDMLQMYLETLKRYFGNKPEGAEIVEDIEGRISELFQPRISDAKQSINIDDVSEVISILGKPEDIAGAGDENFEEGKTDYSAMTSKPSRRLYRDQDNAYIGGVCSGLGAYFNIDPLFFRIIFIGLIFAGGISLIIYPILWIVVPKAVTAAQKLEMKGENVTVSNIERTVREEFEHVKKNINRIDGNSFGDKLRGFINELFQVFGNFLKFVWNILRVLIGIFLIVISLCFIIGIISVSYFNNFMFDNWDDNSFASLKDLLTHFTNSASADALLILAFIILLLPIAGLIYGGLKLIIRFKAKDKWVLATMGIFWIISIIACTLLVFDQITNFKYEGTSTEVGEIQNTKARLLYINAPDPFDNDTQKLERLHRSRMFGVLTSGKSSELFGLVHLDIEKSSSDKMELEVRKEARGVSNDAALNSAKLTKVSYSQLDSVLTINPVYKVSDSQWKIQNVHLTLRVPVGMKIHLNENTRWIIDNIENVNEYWDYNMVNKTWEMTNNGLELVGFNNSQRSNLNATAKKRINIQVSEHYPVSENQIERYRDHNKFGRLVIDGKSFNYGSIEFDIKKSEDDNMKVEVSKNSAGFSNDEASSISKLISYSYEQKDTILWLDPIFVFPQNTKWNDQNVKVTLRIPMNTEVYLSKGLQPLIKDIENHDSWELVNKTWKMTIDGLSQVQE
jgi:phage shock protein PspC (stress-responsive transcriptional regulator)